VNKVCERAPSASVGEVVQVEGSSKPVVLGRRVSVAELKRLRRQFIKQAVALETAGQMAETFVEFLNTNVN
jgi:tRNA uridine 5-carbamoylmethylation protein Kti12